ncbi:MAG: Zn-ribbon domain-containing OB-fold protein [Dehalococcoidia bacterium]|nr:Zn-ribbon domain-containing OB-fold protein [Dehalococcoidia bacterium]
MDYKLTFKEYNKSLKRGKLLGLKCNDCGTYTCPPKMACQGCGSTNLEVVEMKGKGKVVTFTVSYVPAEGRDAEVPYTVVMVELEEGPWLLGNLTDIDPNRVNTDLIGKQVQLGTRMKSLPVDTYTSGNKEAEGAFARATFVFA